MILLLVERAGWYRARIHRLATARIELAAKQEALSKTRQKQQQDRVAERIRAIETEKAQLDATIAEIECLSKLPSQKRPLKLRSTKKGPTLRRPNGGKRQR
ncbi:MAG: hypothetical protein SF028_15100 [Candidatus Sumerlaeia bacterium]|nr:hypothetical protein [Candidatus Sumerlaeia bacterium]